jgi:hypothetical protein
MGKVSALAREKNVEFAVQRFHLSLALASRPSLQLCKTCNDLRERPQLRISLVLAR